MIINLVMWGSAGGIVGGLAFHLINANARIALVANLGTCVLAALCGGTLTVIVHPTYSTIEIPALLIAVFTALAASLVLPILNRLIWPEHRATLKARTLL